MKAYVGVTDSEWYAFLAARPHLDEVNFWRPSSSVSFNVLKPAEPFFFKTHHPHNRVVGGGFFNGFVRLKLSEAWDFFGEANGANSLAQMRSQISHYRHAPLAPDDDPEIGCILIRDVAFLPHGSAAEPPPAFAPNIVQGKSYNTADPAVARYFGDLSAALFGGLVFEIPESTWHRPGPVYGDPRLVPQRLGQRSFQAVVLDAYHRRCAITGGRIRPVLQAAHIRPLPAGGEHRLDNGLLLRSDVHTLFDRGYLGVTPTYELVVSPRLRTEFGNGEAYYAKAGSEITLPERKADRPNPDFLEWHLDTVFKAA